MTGMNKNRVFSAGVLLALAILLSACRVSVDFDRPSQPRVVAEWETAPGEYVICENFANTLTFSFRIPNPANVLRVEQIFKGVVTDQFDTVMHTIPTPANIDGDTVTVSHSFDAFASPYALMDGTELNPSAIVIVPNDPAERTGFVDITYRVVTTLGTHTLVNNLRMEVWGGCTRA